MRHVPKDQTFLHPMAMNLVWKEVEEVDVKINKILKSTQKAIPPVNRMQNTKRLLYFWICEAREELIRRGKKYPLKTGAPVNRKQSSTTGYEVQCFRG